MIKVAVLGAGMIGTAIAIDLAKTFDVTSIDINESSLTRVKQINKNDLVGSMGNQRTIFNRLIISVVRDKF